MAEGWQAAESKLGTMGKVLVFPYDDEWQGCHYEKKEVTVYYKDVESSGIILLTVMARYGSEFGGGK